MTEKDIAETLARIASQKLGFETLETRNSDSLDFRDVGVWCVREALEEAFRAGVAAASQCPAECKGEDL